MIKIRSAKVNDAEALIDLFLTLDNETGFMLIEPGERKTTLEQQRAILEKFSNASFGVYLVAEDKDSHKIIGSIAGIAGTSNRNRHCITLMIGILQAYSGKGLGRALMQHHIDWSEAHHFHRIELTVMQHNERAIHLYKSYGFEIEGVKNNSLLVNGQYINEYYMAKILN